MAEDVLTEKEIHDLYGRCGISQDIEKCGVIEVQIQKRRSKQAEIEEIKKLLSPFVKFKGLYDEYDNYSSERSVFYRLKSHVPFGTSIFEFVIWFNDKKIYPKPVFKVRSKKELDKARMLAMKLKNVGYFPVIVKDFG